MDDLFMCNTISGWKQRKFNESADAQLIERTLSFLRTVGSPLQKALPVLEDFLARVTQAAKLSDQYGKLASDNDVEPYLSTTMYDVTTDLEQLRDSVSQTLSNSPIGRLGGSQSGLKELLDQLPKVIAFLSNPPDWRWGEKEESRRSLQRKGKPKRRSKNEAVIDDITRMGEQLKAEMLSLLAQGENMRKQLLPVFQQLDGQIQAFFDALTREDMDILDKVPHDYGIFGVSTFVEKLSYSVSMIADTLEHLDFMLYHKITNGHPVAEFA